MGIDLSLVAGIGDDESRMTGGIDSHPIAIHDRLIDDSPSMSEDGRAWNGCRLLPSVRLGVVNLNIRDVVLL